MSTWLANWWGLLYAACSVLTYLVAGFLYMRDRRAKEARKEVNTLDRDDLVGGAAIGLLLCSMWPLVIIVMGAVYFFSWAGRPVAPKPEKSEPDPSPVSHSKSYREAQ